jgi:zinc protease
MAGRLLDIVREELHKMQGGEISQGDLDNAKSYLIGSYPLRFDANAKIAAQLLGLWMHGFGADYVYSRNAMIKAVTLDNLNRVAKRLFKPENLIATIAGRPNLHQARARSARATTAPEQQ